LPPITFHALRHTAATLLLSEGEHPKVVQDCWATPRLMSNAAAVMERLLDEEA
jgi:integrase